MNIIGKKALQGLIRGIIASGIVYLFAFAIEFFTFLGMYRDQKTEHGTDLSLGEYLENPMIQMWKPWQIAVVVGAIVILGVIIGVIVGMVHYSLNKEAFKDGLSIEREEGSVRQRQRYAQSIKTMTENVSEKCEEALVYMKNIVEADYVSEKAMGDIMTELVKFVEYERVIKDSMDDGNEKGGRV